MKKKLIIIIPIVIAVVTFFFVYRYYNHEDKTTSLTVTEKTWVQDNSSKKVDFEVINDYPLYGMNGDGVVYNFISDFEENIGLEFNQIPYLKTSKPTTEGLRVRILDNDTKLTNKDLLLFEDYYIAIGKNYQRITNVEDLKNTTFGIFSSDSEDIKYYLKTANNISFKSYDTIDLLYKALDDNEVGMIIVPNIMYLDKTIDNSSYSINYYFTEMEKQVVLTLTKDNKELNNVVSKYYKKWKETKYVTEYNAAYFDYYLERNDINAKTKASLVSKTYKYGYVANAPYEVKMSGKVSGIAGEYLDRVSRLTDIEFKYKKYKTRKDLKKAIDKGEVDVYFDYYNFNGDDYQATLSTFIEEYVVLGMQEDNYIITSFESLRNKNITMLDNDSLYNYFKNNSKADITAVDTLDDINSKRKDGLVVLDREIYNKYRNSKFSKYTILYMNDMMNDYKFMVKKNNKAFYDLFNYIVNTNSYYKYKNAGIESLSASILQDSSFEELYAIILLIIFVPLISLVALYIIFKKKKQVKKVKITDRHKYTDMLTSLKNRNYLNAKMAEWEDSKVYPQAIVMVDLNNVKYVNDNYGHEEGDQLIVKAAGVLVNTQLENSEIIRTDGNEFMIYLVGYSDRQIATYTKKLSKELKNLPHEFGAGVGYSMILDEIKSLDDAINEATLDMVTNKEEYK